VRVLYEPLPETAFIPRIRRRPAAKRGPPNSEPSTVELDAVPRQSLSLVGDTGRGAVYADVDPRTCNPLTRSGFADPRAGPAGGTGPALATAARAASPSVPTPMLLLLSSWLGLTLGFGFVANRAVASADPR
jgi:hypothetical protein